MNARQPTISAIVPVHNGAAYIADALRSIRAQTHPVTTVIVVDDGSTDETAAIVRRTDPDARLIQQPQAGPGAARNAGAAHADGDWLAFLDHDDLWPADRTSALVEALAAAPGAGMICGRMRLEEMPDATPDMRLRRADGTVVPFLLQSTLIRRDVWHALGGMDLRRVHGEDVDFYLRLTDAGIEAATIDATTLIYRLHGQNRSRVIDVGLDAMLMTMRAAIERRRAQRVG